MTKENLIGWIGNVFFVVGGILLAKKCVWGFVLQIFGNICYVIQGYRLNISSLMVISGILAYISVYGIYNWLK